MTYEPSLLEIAEIKSILGIQGNEHDQYLSMMIPILYEHVVAICNNDFILPTTGEVHLPGGVRLYIAKACEHNMNSAGLKSRSMGTVSYDYNVEFPNSLIMYLRPYRRLKFHATR